MELPAFNTLQLDPARGLQNSLREQMTQWICQGRLPPGTQLPASRLLAKQAGVSRNTVLQVIEQLKAEGYLESQAGKGVFVSGQITSTLETLPPPTVDPLAAHTMPVTRFQTPLQGTTPPDYDSPAHPPFTLGLPDLNVFPHKIWCTLTHRHAKRRALQGYDHPAGFPPLRQAIADYLKLCRGVFCHPDQVLITQGAQHALFLCAWALLQPGEAIAMENPGYRRARSVFELTQANVIPVPVTSEGLDLTALMQHTITTGRYPKLLYTTPSHQYPLGGVLPASERMRLLRWAAEHQVWIIEDDYDSEYHFLNKPVAAMQGMAPNTPVIYMGSFSKTLFPGLRLGYLVLPESLVGAFCHAKNLTTGDIPRFSQAVTTDFLTEGHFTRHLRRMRQCYQEKWSDFTGLIQQALAGKFEVFGQSAGMHLTLSASGRCDLALMQQLKHAGFGGGPLSQYYLPASENAKTGLVLGFAHSSPVDRRRLIDVLSRLSPD